MTDDPQLRDIDQTILHHIQNGHNDTQKITSKTTIKTHRVRYSLKKLQQQGLITVTQPDKMVERVINGQKRVFQHPKQAQLTEKGHQYLKQSDKEDLKTYQDMSHRELVEKTRTIETRTNKLENKFDVFKKQIRDKLS